MSTEVQETTVEDAGKNEKTFTQEDVNRIVQDRLSRERKVSSDAEKTLEDRERELAQKEQEIAFKAVLDSKGIPKEIYEALNCTSEEAFNKSIEILEPYFQKLKEPIRNAVGPTRGAIHVDPIRKAMGLK